MRKAVLVLLLVLVSLGIGVVLYMQFTKTTPVFAGGEKTVIHEGQSICMNNKYYSGLSKAEVDVALMDLEDGIEGAQTAYDAILAKGTPVFNPTFFINMMDNGTEYFRIMGEASDEQLPGQQQVGFFCHDLVLNVYTDANCQILSARSLMPTEPSEMRVTLPVISDDSLSAIITCDRSSTFDINFAFLDGKTTSTVTFEWTYDVKNSAPLNLSGLNEQSLVVDVIFTLENGVVSAHFA